MSEDMDLPHKGFFLATLTIALSDRSFSDFIRTGANSNYLPEFQARIADLQRRLEQFDKRTFTIRSQQDGFDLSDPISVNLTGFTVTSLSYIEGSVVAKIQIGCTVIAATTAFLAAYPDAKTGYTELRDDLIAVATGIFADLQENAPSEPSGRDSSVRYYFLRPDRAEENLIKLALELRSDSSNLEGEHETVSVVRD